MAAEVALEAISSLTTVGTVLDPMSGSGTVLRQAMHYGHRAIGFDIDPLAVLISRVSTRHLDVTEMAKVGNEIADRAASGQHDEVDLPWIDGDEETKRFIDFWFAPEQRRVLRALSWRVSRIGGPVGDALKLAISKTIVTKEPRASLARDTSHSRPHRVVVTNEYDVIQGFRKATTQVGRQLSQGRSSRAAIVGTRDARVLPSWLTDRVNLVVTSPPYGNAIDYLRGHRLALVWLGYTIQQLRGIRAASVGASGTLDEESCAREIRELARVLGALDDLEAKVQHRLESFARDMRLVLMQIYRVLRPDGRAVLVVGNSNVKGVFLDNARMVAKAAEIVGLREVSRYSRAIPANHRYLPPPETEGALSLNKRMKEEVVLTFEKKTGG